MKLGIDHLKVVVKFGVDLGGAIDEALKDGKVTIADAGDFYAPLMEIPGVSAALSSVVPEFKDLDSAELGELTTYAVGELHIAEAHVLEVIEASLEAAVSIYKLVGKIKAVKAVAVVPAAPVA